MQDILNEMSSRGLRPDTLELDGKIHRFKDGRDDHKNSGWYVGFQNHTQAGDVFQVVVYSSYRHSETYQYQTNVKMSTHDRRAVKDQIRKAQALAEKNRLEYQEKVAKEVEEKWEKLSKSGASEYLKQKQVVDVEMDIRFDNFNGDIYVPARDLNGKLWSLQRITREGDKIFHLGGRVRACYLALGSIESADTIFLAEGLSTCASIRLAINQTVVCAFNSGNLEVVTAELKSAYPDKEFVICGDDDIFKETNAGREKAEASAKKCLGVVVFPKFESLDTKPTDFNDLHVLEGVDKVREQIESASQKKVKSFVLALGFKDGDYFFTSSANRQIVCINKFVETDFLKLMPVEYWEALYPGSQARVDWTNARSDLMTKARSKNIFQPRHVRGAGVWNDEGRIVVNMGDHLVVDGVRVELGEIKSRFFYTLGSSLARLHSNPLRADECNTLVEACSSFRWLKPDYGFLIAGGLVLSRICGALPVRPHIWVTGGRETGKSTLFERLIRPIIGDSVLYVFGATSEAGIRQSLRADAVPVMFDEFETTGQGSAERVGACVELMRAAWSDSGAYIIKGSSGGTANAFQVRFCAIVSSIRTQLTNDADVSRFARIELAPHGSDLAHWDKLSKLLDSIDREYGERLFARTIKLAPVLLANYKTLKKALSGRAGQRFGDQYGMLLAGYSILLQDEPITDVQAEMIASNVILADEKEEAKTSDHDDALNIAEVKKIRFERDTMTKEMTVIEMILKTKDGDVFIGEALQRMGIKVLSDCVAFAINNPELEGQIYRGTRWSQTWANSLSRIPGAKRRVQVWVGGKNQKCVTIPASRFWS